ncbi:MAG: helix-turn-helix domain-containing protein [Bradyrhizobium sp.]|uniref:helix-turn-helix domain-containing protein n=1 Tax=Bradyrhizobium sp. TaxID=376 RepID=UPI001D3AE26A|nr:helix-turn-helix domain-containing protein [Bradyrhizobium sp.]MBV9562034.1 helix-turn-helix domain-containing protein [Bradyrhizobium sp.]
MPEAPSNLPSPVSMPARRLTIGTWSAELLSRQSYCASYTAAAPIIGFAFDHQAGIHAFCSDRRVDFHTRPNGLAHVPEGCDVYSRSDSGGEYLRITLRPEPGEQPWPRFSDRIDRAAIDVAYALRRALLTDAARDALICEQLVHILKERAAAVSGDPSPTPAAWMTPRRLRLVDELIEARLDMALTVEQIAATLGLSAGFFARAFKAAIGKSPHDHIIDRRLARARALLQGTESDLGAIALASGFASHAHMTATFRKRLGVTPSEMRGGQPPQRAR